MAFFSQTSLAVDRVSIDNLDCDPSVSIGDWVRLNSLNVLIKAQADSFGNSNVLGLCEAKSGTTKATVLVLGLSEEIFTGLDVTKEYYLSETTAGAMHVAPVTTTAGQIVLKVGQPVTDKRFLVLKGIRMQRA